MIQIKFCGITNLKDALNALELEIDYLGFIIEVSESPRSLKLEEFELIVNQIKRTNKKTRIVAVMVNPKMKLVEYVISNKLADCIQFHGEESVNFCEKYKSQIEIWKAFRLFTDDSSGIYEIIKGYKYCADKILLDAKHSNFEAFNTYTKLKEENFSLILAGGLNSNNILNYIHALKPEMVDLSGGIEISPGIKSYEKMYEFVTKLRNYKF